MNSPSTQQPSSIDLGFNLLAGALVGSVIAVEMGLLDMLVWGIGSSDNVEVEQLVRLSPQGTAWAVSAFWRQGRSVASWRPSSRDAPAARQLAAQSAFSIWVLGSFVYAVFGGLHVSLAFHLVLIDALLAFALAIAAYCLWRELLRWLRRGHVWNVVLAIAAMNATAVDSTGGARRFIIAKRRRVMGQEAKKLSRRDLFKVGTAIAGVALLQPSLVQLAIGKHEDKSYDPDETGATSPFPSSCGRRN